MKITKQMERAREAEIYWAERRNEATTTKPLEYYRRMEMKASERWHEANKRANPL